MILKKITIFITLILFFASCATKEQFNEAIYEGLKSRERITHPKEYDEKNENIDYKEYKDKIDKSKF